MSGFIEVVRQLASLEAVEGADDDEEEVVAHWGQHEPQWRGAAEFYILLSGNGLDLHGISGEYGERNSQNDPLKHN